MRVRTRFIVAVAVAAGLLITQIVAVGALLRELQNAANLIASAHWMIEANFDAQAKVAALRQDVRRMPSRIASSLAVDTTVSSGWTALKIRIESELASDRAALLQPGSLSSAVKMLEIATDEYGKTISAMQGDANLDSLIERAVYFDKSLEAFAAALDVLTIELRKQLRDAVEHERAIHDLPMVAAILIGGIMVVALLAFAWFYVDRKLIARVTAISDAMHDIAGGNLHRPLPLTEGGDEVSEMAKALTVFRDTAIEVEEHKLREIASARQRLVDAIEAISEGFALYDADDRLVLCNRQYREMLHRGNLDDVAEGMSFEEIIRRAAARGMVKEAIDHTEGWVAERLALHREARVNQIQRRSGDRWIRISERHTTEGGIVSVYSDISELKQHEEELRRLVAELEDARRSALAASEAKSGFLANMSHELRTPMNAIIGFTRIVMRRAKDALPAKQYENLEKILISADHLLALINDVLDLSKVEAGRMEVHPSAFTLGPLVEACLKTVEPMVKSDQLRLASELDPAIPDLFNDQGKLKQIIMNLLSNAVKFTERGQVMLRATRRNGHIEIVVSDTGIGIPADSLESIFEEFKQVDSGAMRQHGGTGLGLSISRKLARLLGGDITVESSLGEGSTFRLTIPVMISAPSRLPRVPAEFPMAQPEPPASEAGGDHRLVLAIDDDPNAIELLRQNLADSGYRVVGALSGDEGLRKARELRPFVITLDILMPEKDGWQVLQELKSDQATKHIPIVVFSIIDEKDLGYRLGAFDYAVKPLDAEGLKQILDRVPRSGNRVLVVDDDPQVLDLVRQLLDGKPFEVSGVSNGKDALVAIEREPPDILLLDLLMPQMDGFEVLSRMAGNPASRNIPVIVLTAKSLTVEERLQLQQRVQRVIEKHELGVGTLVTELRRALSAYGRPEPIQTG